MEDWRARVEAAGLKSNPVVLQGPPQKFVSSSRVLPNVHEALRQNDLTSKTPSTQPSLPKKAPPTTGKGLPAAGFYRVEEPPRIGSEQIQPAPPPKLPDLLQSLQHIHLVHLSQLFLNQSKNLQHRPTRKVGFKDFPRDQHGNPDVPMPAAPAVDPTKVGAPALKATPISCMPAPRGVLAPQPMDSCSSSSTRTRVQMAYGQKSKKRYVKSPSDIDWHFPLKDQLEPQLTGGPDPKKTFEELGFLRNRIPKMDDDGFKKIFPATETCILCVNHKNGSRHSSI